jgi:membrane-associated phospholipid phosphatase
LAGAFVFAGATGLFRMAFGAHYLSDVCAAMLIMALLVLVLHRLILRPRHEGTRPSRT